MATTAIAVQVFHAFVVMVTVANASVANLTCTKTSMYIYVTPTHVA